MSRLSFCQQRRFLPTRTRYILYPPPSSDTPLPSDTVVPDFFERAPRSNELLNVLNSKDFFFTAKIVSSTKERNRIARCTPSALLSPSSPSPRRWSTLFHKSRMCRRKIQVNYFCVYFGSGKRYHICHVRDTTFPVTKFARPIFNGFANCPPHLEYQAQIINYCGDHKLLWGWRQKSTVSLPSDSQNKNP
jgi:hypothetical protein